MSKALHGQNKKTLISKKSSCEFYYFKFFIFLVTMSEILLTLLIGKREQTVINGMILQKSFIVLQSQRHFEKENNVGKDGIIILIQIWKGTKLIIFSKIIAIVLFLFGIGGIGLWRKICSCWNYLLSLEINGLL